MGITSRNWVDGVTRELVEERVGDELGAEVRGPD